MNELKAFDGIYFYRKMQLNIYEVVYDAFFEQKCME